MRRTETVDLDGRTVTVKELTVAEVRLWFKALEKAGEGGIDVVDECLIEDMSLGDVRRMTDLQPADMDELTPSEVEQLMAVCMGLNPHFFRMRGNLLAVAKAVHQQAPAETLKEPPAV